MDAERAVGRVKPATVVKEPCISLDLFPTVLEVAGVSEGELKSRLEGRSLMPLLRGGNATGAPRALIWRMGPQHAARFGEWKLVVRHGRMELYNLRKDIGETTDLAAKEPERLKQMLALYDGWDEHNIAPRWRRSDAVDEQ